MSFDEVDLNYIYGAIRFQLMETNWDLSDPDSWEEVNALKKLEMEIGNTLDGNGSAGIYDLWLDQYCLGHDRF